jgi:hypothetical protein
LKQISLNITSGTNSDSVKPANYHRDRHDAEEEILILPKKKPQCFTIDPGGIDPAGPEFKTFVYRTKPGRIPARILRHLLLQ